MFPQTLTGIQLNFTGDERKRAIGLYAIALSTGAVVGQILGGALISANIAGRSSRGRKSAGTGHHVQALPVVLLGAGGLGLGIQFSALIRHLTTAVPAQYAADISGVRTTALQIGAGIGVAAFAVVALLATATAALTNLAGSRQRNPVGRPPPPSCLGEPVVG